MIDIKYNEEVIREFLKEEIMEYYDEEVIFDYGEYSDREVEDYDSIKCDEDFISFLDYIIDERMTNSKYNIIEFIQNNKLNIYRKILVDDKWLSRLINNKVKGFGLHWCWDKEVVEPHSGYNQKGKTNEVLIHAVVDINNIDWNETLERNSSLINSEEKEIKLFRGVPLFINNLHYNNKLITSGLYNKYVKSSHK